MTPTETTQHFLSLKDYDQIKIIDSLTHNTGIALMAATKLAEPHRTDELEKRLHNQVTWGYIDGSNYVASLLGCELTEDQLLVILEKCIEKCDLENAKKTAEYLGRELTAEELETMFRLFITKDDRSLFSAKRIALLLPKGKREAAMELVLSGHIMNCDLENARDTVVHLGRELTEGEILRILRPILEGKNTWSHDWRIITTFSEPKRTAALERLLEVSRGTNINTYVEVSKALGKVPETSILERFLREALQELSLGNAEEVLKHLGREMSQEEADSVLNTSIEKGDRSRTLEIVRRYHQRTLTTKEYSRLLCAQMSHDKTHVWDTADELLRSL